MSQHRNQTRLANYPDESLDGFAEVIAAQPGDIITGSDIADIAEDLLRNNDSVRDSVNAYITAITSNGSRLRPELAEITDLDSFLRNEDLLGQFRNIFSIDNLDDVRGIAGLSINP